MRDVYLKYTTFIQFTVSKSDKTDKRRERKKCDKTKFRNCMKTAGKMHDSTRLLLFLPRSVCPISFTSQKSGKVTISH